MAVAQGQTSRSADGLGGRDAAEAEPTSYVQISPLDSARVAVTPGELDLQHPRAEAPSAAELTSALEPSPHRLTTGGQAEEADAHPHDGSSAEFCAPIANAFVPAAACAENQVEASQVNSPRRTLRVLLVDDDALVLRALQRAIRKHHDISSATSAEQALAILAERSVDAVVTDYELCSEHNGVWLLEQAKVKYPNVGRILMSASEVEDVGQHMASGLVQRFASKRSGYPALIAYLDAFADGLFAEQTRAMLDSSVFTPHSELRRIRA